MNNKPEKLEKMVIICKICKKEIKLSLVKGLYSDMCLSNWVCENCCPNYLEKRKMLTIQRMELGGL